MRSAFALRIISGMIIFISRLSRSAERSKRYFHGRGRNGKRQVQTLPSSPSQALTRQLPQRGSLWRNCTLCNLTGDFPAMPRPLPLGEVASRSDDGEGEPAAPQRRAFAESGAAPAIFLYDPSREKVPRENPQIFPGDKL